MCDAERRAMVAGWYIGQIVGEIMIPPEPYTKPVRIWDPSERRWVAFPHPLLTPPAQFRSRHDWLPAVLESSCSRSPRSSRRRSCPRCGPTSCCASCTTARSGPARRAAGCSPSPVSASWPSGCATAPAATARAGSLRSRLPAHRTNAKTPPSSGSPAPAAPPSWFASTSSPVAGPKTASRGRTSGSTPGKQATSVPLLYDLAPDVALARGHHRRAAAQGAPDARPGRRGLRRSSRDRRRTPALPDWDAF